MSSLDEFNMVFPIKCILWTDKQKKLEDGAKKSTPQNLSWTWFAADLPKNQCKTALWRKASSEMCFIIWKNTFSDFFLHLAAERWILVPVQCFVFGLGCNRWLCFHNWSSCRMCLWKANESLSLMVSLYGGTNWGGVIHLSPHGWPEAVAWAAEAADALSWRLRTVHWNKRNKINRNISVYQKGSYLRVKLLSHTSQTETFDLNFLRGSIFDTGYPRLVKNNTFTALRRSDFHSHNKLWLPLSWSRSSSSRDPGGDAYPPSETTLRFGKRTYPSGDKDPRPEEEEEAELLPEPIDFGRAPEGWTLLPHGRSTLFSERKHILWGKCNQM